MKVAFISTILPTGHFSQYITRGLVATKECEVLIYADDQPRNLTVEGCGTIKLVWAKSVKYIWQIVKQARLDRPDVIHVQHELNMYGGSVTAALFPLLLLALRALGFKLVVTVHAAVFKTQLDDEFVRMFGKDPARLKPRYLRAFFAVLYRCISHLSHAMIVHTQLTKRILIEDYGVDGAKVRVIPCAIPDKPRLQQGRRDYFFYFGYMVRRKGLGFALDGFRQFIAEQPQSSWRLVLAGGVIPGQEAAYDEIKEMIKRTNLQDRIILKGFIEERDQDELYANAYAVVIPAVLSMGSSGPLYHANSYGKCTIASRVGHFEEDIDHLKTGILTDNQHWADAFAQAAARPELVAAIEEQVAAKAVARAPLATARIYLEAYRSVR